MSGQRRQDGCTRSYCENDTPCCALLKQLQARFDQMKLEYDRKVVQIDTYRGDLGLLRRENHRLTVDNERLTRRLDYMIENYKEVRD